MKSYYLSIVFVLVFSTCTTKESPPKKVLTTSVPESAGFSAERMARLDSSMNQWVKGKWINGAVALVARDGKIAYYKSYGHNDLNNQEKLNQNHIFRIASQTKAITSVAVMMLYEEGKFLLEDPVSKFIPSFTNIQVVDKFNEKDTTYTTVPAKRPITIRDLLTHTSGIGYPTIGSKAENAIYAKNKITVGLDVSDDDLGQAMNRLGKLPLMHQPGEKWTYGLNTDLLGYLVEIWSGMSLDEFFSKRIFQPLDMKDTYFNIPANKADLLVNFFSEDSTGVHLEENALGLDMNYPLRNKTYFSGGGGLSSSIYDYAIFLQMLLNGGEYNGVRLLSRNTVRMMTMNQINDLNLGHDKFGLGFAIVTEKGSSMLPHQEGTFSWGGAFATSYWVDPKEKMVVLLYCQMWGAHNDTINDTFKVLVYQALND